MYWATNGTITGAAMAYLLGPRDNIRRGNLTPFVQTLVGIRITSSPPPNASACSRRRNRSAKSQFPTGGNTGAAHAKRVVSFVSCDTGLALMTGADLSLVSHAGSRSGLA